MSIFLILFFTALLSIGFMLGRKLFMLKKSGMLENRVFGDEDFVFIVPDVEEISSVAGKNLKKIGYVALVSGMRIYMLSSNFLSKKYEDVKSKVIEIKNKNNIGARIIKSERKEASKFLKVIGEYKTKIKRIKRKIKEEEGLN